MDNSCLDLIGTFYVEDYPIPLYLNDIHANHKESPAIKQELAHAMGVTQGLSPTSGQRIWECGRNCA